MKEIYEDFDLSHPALKTGEQMSKQDTGEYIVQQRKVSSGEHPKKEDGELKQENNLKALFKVSVFLTREEYYALKLGSFLSKRSVSSIIRGELGEYVNRVKPLLTGSGGFNYELLRKKYDKIYKKEES